VIALPVHPDPAPHGPGAGPAAPEEVWARELDWHLAVLGRWFRVLAYSVLRFPREAVLQRPRAVRRPARAFRAACHRDVAVAEYQVHGTRRFTALTNVRTARSSLPGREGTCYPLRPGLIVTFIRMITSKKTDTAAVAGDRACDLAASLSLSGAHKAPILLHE
jgi:hypothetical protein